MSESITVKDYPHELIHVSLCNGPVAYLKYKPILGHYVQPDEMVRIDGTKLYLSDYLVCGTCGSGDIQRDFLPSNIRLRKGADV